MEAAGTSLLAPVPRQCCAMAADGTGTMRSRGATLVLGVVAAIVFLRSESSAQSGNITGVVRDTVGAPVTAAEITVGDARTFSDSVGRFSIAFAPRASVLLSVRRMGFEP